MPPEETASHAVLWTRLEKVRPGRQPTLTHDRIAASAVAIADVEGGIDAVSMRKVARDLGVGTMSLYRYVRTKHELGELMFDRVMGELSLSDVPTTTWREALTVAARQMRQMMLRHPWTAVGLGSRPSMGPNTLRWVEESTARMDQAGLSIDQVMDMTGTVTAFVTGTVQYELGTQEAQRVTGLSEEQWREQMGPYVRDVIAGGKHPYFERIVIEAEDFPSPDETFERRLGYVLDGLATGLGLEP